MVVVATKPNKMGLRIDATIYETKQRGGKKTNGWSHDDRQGRTNGTRTSDTC